MKYIFNSGGFIDSIDDIWQFFTFANSHKQKLDNTTLISNGNKLDSSLMANGSVSNEGFQCLNGITVNICRTL